MTPKEIISEAIATYGCKKALILVSGGHDSLTNLYVSVPVLNELNIPFVVYHGDTTIGIKETREHVIKVCELNNWPLVIRRPPEGCHYRDIVLKYGFPGPTKTSHQFMYRRLKERALRRYVTREAKSTPYARENILLLSGVRQQESKIRMGYKNHTSKIYSQIWCNPIFYFSKEDVEQTMFDYKIPRNPVKDLICISGECLCGAFAGFEEWYEIKKHFPESAKEIEELWEEAKKRGFPWHWAQGPVEWKKKNPAGQIDMFMCVGCEAKHDYKTEETKTTEIL